MRATTKEIIQMTLVLVVLFLILTHYTGFSRDVAASAKGYGEAVTDLQGRG